MGSVVLAAVLGALPSRALAEESGDGAAGDGSAKRQPEEDPSETEPEKAPDDAPSEKAPEKAPDDAPSEKAPEKAPDDAPREKAPEEAEEKSPKGEGAPEAKEKEAPPEKDAKKARPRKSAKRREGGGDKREGASGEAKDKEIIRAVRPSRYIGIRARSVKLKSKSHTRLLNIAKRYHEATGKKLLITGGDRTPHRQAELMYRMLAKGDDLLKLYTRVRLVRELTDIYETGKAKKRGARNIIRAMAKAIKKQVQRGEYVSHHLAFTAADVRSRGLKDDQVNALRKAVSAEPGAKLVDERKSDAPHFHLSL